MQAIQILEPARLAILRRLLDGAASVNDLASAIGRAPAATSQHLRLLREAGYVVTHRRGHRIYYRIDEQRFSPIRQLIRAVYLLN